MDRLTHDKEWWRERAVKLTEKGYAPGIKGPTAMHWAIGQEADDYRYWKVGFDQEHASLEDALRWELKNYFCSLRRCPPEACRNYTGANPCVNDAYDEANSWIEKKKKKWERERRKGKGNFGEFLKNRWIEWIDNGEREKEKGVFSRMISRVKGLTRRDISSAPPQQQQQQVTADLGFYKPGSRPPGSNSRKIGGKNKRKVYFVNKINVLGKQKRVYKYVGNKKKYIKYKNKYVLLKKYKEMQMKKTKVKKTKVKKTKK